MNRKLIVIVALILGAFAVQSVQSVQAAVMEEGARTNPAWQAEYEALGNQYESVVWLAAFDGPDRVRRGGAVRIHEQWLLTAAHSVHRSGTHQFYDGYYVGTGDNVYQNPGNFFVAQDWFVHPEYTSEIHSPDLALLYFPDGLGDVPIAERFRGTDQIGELLTMVGYGRPGFPSTGWLDSDGKRRGCQTYLTQFGGTWMNAPDYQAMAEFYRFNNLHLNGLGSPGDSGGGMFNEDGELMGIMGFVLPGAGYIEHYPSAA